MLIIKENKEFRSSTFDVREIDSEKNIISQRKVNIKIIRRKMSGHIRFIFFNSEMVAIEVASKFLNRCMSESPLTTRNQAATVLRFFFTYCEIYGADIANLTIDDVNEYKSFLAGIVQGYNLTSRTPATINLHLSIIRKFYRYLNISCKPLEEAYVSHYSLYSGLSDSAMTVALNKYKTSYSIESRKIVPKFISPAEFINLYKIAQQSKDTIALTLMCLMYQNGLRLGEALGLTIEDLEIITVDERPTPVIYLRNRISDDSFQFCKNLYHPQDFSEYNQEFYKQCKSKIYIDFKLYNLLAEIIEQIHPKLNLAYPSNYAKALADKVTKRTDIINNHYIFLNKYGNRLTAQTWNKRLKQYFLQSGIEIDTEKKVSNLSHRFRHGFAMFQAHFKKDPVSVLTLQHLMRHKNITATMVYYNPTEEMIFNERMNLTKELDELLRSTK